VYSELVNLSFNKFKISLTKHENTWVKLSQYYRAFFKFFVLLKGRGFSSRYEHLNNELEIEIR